jgi:CubicO group peptidase (beta-lactamase class C family)
MTLDRRQMMTALGAVLTIQGAHPAFAAPGIEQRLAEAKTAGRVFGLHALLVSQGGRTVFEHYEANEDERLGRPLGVVNYGPTMMHDLRSVSKSVVSLLYGIALAEGKVPPPEAKLYAQFPEYPELAGAPGRDQLTVAHVLSMTMGTRWDEFTVPYGGSGNSETDMEAAPDRYRYALAQPIIESPGSHWIYNGGATALVGRLLAKSTGEKLHPYARRVLFDPMEFGPTEWTVGRDGDERAASGLRLLPRDLLKVGQLVLAGGLWKGRQVVPADWLKRATTQVVAIEGRGGYGYQWYTGDVPIGSPAHAEQWIGGIGWGGQRLFIVPKLDLAVAINCGNYSRPVMQQGQVGTAIIREVVLPSLG